MSLPNRIKQARLVRILFVYLGASWVVVEVADLLQEQLQLPSWVVPVTIILLLVGLVVVLATAMVQASPSTDRKEAAGQVPTDWELDLGDLARSIRGGRLPHLTWGRALTGGGLAFLVLFGLAALFLPGDDGPGPAPLAADPAAPGLAVLPFRVSGQDLAPWREGLVDLLSRNLDGVGDVRAIDSRTVLARWSELVGDAATPDLATALAVADRTGARWALVGSAVEVGSRVRVSADVYDVATGQRLDGAATEGSPDSLFALVDGLSVEVARTLLEREDPDLPGLRLSSITTASPEALRRFLEGEAAYRRLAFDGAMAAYEAAIAVDPGFALAWFRLGSARGWAAAGGGEAARARAYEHRDRLPEREALMVEAEYRSRSGALPSGVSLLRSGVRRFPDDPEMWYQLGDIYIHWGPQLRVTPSQAEEALRRAVELDPGFAPYRIHLVELALLRGDSAEAASRLEAETALAGPGSRYVRAHRLVFDYLYGDDVVRDRVVAALDTIPSQVRGLVRTPTALEGEKAGEWLELANRLCEDLLTNPTDVEGAPLYICFWTLVANGRIDDARRMGEVTERVVPAIPASVHIIFRQTGIDPDAPIADPRRVLAGALGPAEGGTVDPALVVAGILATERGETALADSILDLFASAADSMQTSGDTLDARLVRGLGEGLAGYRALAAQQPDTARLHLEAALDKLAGGTGPENAFRTVLAWPLAELYARDGRYREAIELYASLWDGLHAGPALMRQADIHERLGEADRARELRTRFLALWSGADPEHPLVREARSALGPG